MYSVLIFEDGRYGRRHDEAGRGHTEEAGRE